MTNSFESVGEGSMTSSRHNFGCRSQFDLDPRAASFPRPGLIQARAQLTQARFLKNSKDYSGNFTKPLDFRKYEHHNKANSLTAATNKKETACEKSHALRPFGGLCNGVHTSGCLFGFQQFSMLDRPHPQDVAVRPASVSGFGTVVNREALLVYMLELPSGVRGFVILSSRFELLY